ncbi:MAG: Uncharacterized protein XE06_1118, partial [Anaerolineaceae bacterium 46_22]
MNKRSKKEKEKILKKVLPIIFLVVVLLSACQPVPTQEVIETITTEPAVEDTLAPTEPPAADPTQTSLPATPTQAHVFEPWITLEPIASGLTAPVALAAPDDASSRIFIVDQVGLIYIVDSEDNLLETPFLDLHNQLVNLNSNYDERGLLGMAFHPDYVNNGRFFVYYSAPLRGSGQAGNNHTSVLSEFIVSEADPNLADPDSEKIILQIDQPQGNHNAGAITFGPDG